MTQVKTEDIPKAAVDAEGKLHSDFFVAVRERGMVTAMLDIPGQRYEKEHPGMKCRWTYAPPNGDLTMITAYESYGYKVVDWGELPGTESSKTSGPVRCGDLVLMAAPARIHQAILDEDARRAEEDLKLPERTYRENVEELSVRRRDGVLEKGKPVGNVRRTEQLVKTNLPQE